MCVVWKGAKTIQSPGDEPLHLHMDNYGALMDAPGSACDERCAIVDLRSGTSISYGAFKNNARRVAGWALCQGLAPGDAVALVMANRADMLWCLYGLVRAGVVPVLVNPALGVDAMAHVLRDSGARKIVTWSADAPHLTAAVNSLKSIVSIIDLNESDTLVHDPSDFVFKADEKSVAMMCYTSGSTGKPKGVMLSHQGQLWTTGLQADYMQRLIEADTLRAYLPVPMFHINAHFGVFQPVFSTGGTVVLAPGFNAAQALEDMGRYDCNFTVGVPTLYAMLMKAADETGADLPALEAAFCGSAPGQADLLRRFEARFGCRMCHVYGLTEVGAGVLGPPPEGPRGSLSSCGQVPSSDIALKLIDPDTGEAGAQGELWINCPSVTLGYKNLPDLTAEKIQDGWLRTGDIMRRDEDGWYFFLGRSDDMFLCGGENVYPLEVEALLMAHPDITAVSVVPVVHAAKGQAPAALVVTANAGLTEKTVKSFALGNGPAFLHPRVVVFADALPLGPTGKVDKAAVSALITARQSKSAA